MEAWKLELYGYSNELYHYGTKGMHWGTRHWQNPDGTFNEAGKQRYFSKGSGENYQPVKSNNRHSRAAKAIQKDIDSLKSSGKMKNVSESDRKKMISSLEQVRDKQLAKSKKVEDRKANKKQLTPEQKQKITKAAVGALAAAAVVGGTVYLAKTGKLNGVADAGKSLINKGKAAVSKKIESLSQKKLDSKLSDWTKNVKATHDSAMDKVLGSSGTAKRAMLDRQSSLTDAQKAEVAKKRAENTKKILDKMYEEKLNDPNVTKWSMTVDGITRSFDKTKG